MDTTVAVALIAAVPPTLAVIASSIRGQRDRVKHADVAELKLDNIHVLVNGRLDEALARIKHLEEALDLEPGTGIALTSVIKDAIDLREDQK